MQKTLAIIKPDVCRDGKAEAVRDEIVLAGFSVLAEKEVHLTKEEAGQFYAEHVSKPFYASLVNFMTSGPCRVLVLCKANAIEEWRHLLTSQIRPVFGTDSTMNAVHGSDSFASACREIRFFFPNMVIEPIMNAGDVHEFIVSSVQPVLTKGLTELVSLKPSDPIRWLAHWLLQNNPNLPRVSSASEAQPAQENRQAVAEKS